ncbi:MAG: single-stranded DNA-binding protein, partial [Bacteroidetes bacterium]|nr:single-stranded DNA-binding protein [Bacteroidota bacterium]
MKNLRNRVQLIGNLGKDPEIRNLENGKTVANFSMATSEIYRNNGGEKITDTQW